MGDSDSEPLTLSPHTFSALQQFYSEQEEKEALATQDTQPEVGEDWQLSQFWYSRDTALTLARVCAKVVGPQGRVACVSAPTLFKAIKEHEPDLSAVLLEYDKRFSFYGPDFHFYDFNQPLSVAPELKSSFDLVFADPPFLSTECLTSTAVTCKFLSKGEGRLVLCTGAVMGELAHRLMGLELAKFQPKHENNLANQFQCFANFNLDSVIEELR